MADVNNDYTNKLNGITKTKFANKVKVMYPESVKFISRISLDDEHTLGRKYEFPVDLVLEQGMTYAAAGSGAFSFEDSEAGEMKPAEVDATNYLFRGTIDYETAARADKKGDAAYENAIQKVIKRVNTAMRKRMELSFLYDQRTLGSVETVAAGSAATEKILTIHRKNWASGIWLGMKNAKLDFYAVDTAGKPTGTKLNATGAAKIKKVDINNRKLTITFALQADADAVVANTSPASASHIVFRNSVNNWTTGIFTIASNTGVLHGIDGSDFELWTGNSYSNGDAELTLKRLYAAMGPAIGKGLGEEGVTVWLNPITLGNLIAAEATLRRYAEAGSGKAENGFRGVKFDSLVGPMEFVPYINIKEGQALVGPMETLKKIGATDATMQAPGRKQYEYFKALEAKAAYEVQMYANLGLACEAPAKWTVITDIVNS